jgi:hypothetical protein
MIVNNIISKIFKFFYENQVLFLLNNYKRELGSQIILIVENLLICNGT